MKSWPVLTTEDGIYQPMIQFKNNSAGNMRHREWLHNVKNKPKPMMLVIDESPISVEVLREMTRLLQNNLSMPSELSCDATYNFIADQLDASQD